MRGLAEQGVLTEELAAAAGIKLKQPQQRRLRLPSIRLRRLTMPRLRLPRVQLPPLRMLLPRRAQRSITLDMPPSSAPAFVTVNGNSAGGAAELCETPAVALLAPAMPPVPDTPPPELTGGLGGAALAEIPDPTLREAALHDVLAAPTIELPAVELLALSDAYVDSEEDAWTAEDRALAVASVIAGIWAKHELKSPILALDTSIAAGNGQVIVTIDQHPDEDEQIADLPELIVAQCPAWRASWKQELLAVDVVMNDAQPPGGGPLLVPILAHGRGGKTVRFYPLASWQHLGLYGGSALGVLHAVLGSLLYNQPPSHVALAIIDNGEITPLYRDVAHLVRLPGSMHESVELLAQAIKRGVPDEVRPLVLVVVEPHDLLLNRLSAIAARLRARPNTPVHLLLVQEHLSSAGRELYPLLPALITSGGRGPLALLPGQGDWPKHSEARLIGRGMRVDGRAIAIDEADIAALLTHLRGKLVGLPLVLWDAPVPLFPPALASTEPPIIEGVSTLHEDLVQPSVAIADVHSPAHSATNDNRRTHISRLIVAQ